MFFGWQHDVLDILLNGNKRASLNIVITPVCNQVLDGCTGTGAELYFVEYDQGTGFLAFRLAGSKFPPEVKFQTHEKHIEVIQIKVEKLHYLRIYLAEVHQNVRLVFFACKFFHDITFPYTPGSFYQKGSITLMVFLPFQQFIIYLSFHNSPIHLYCLINISRIRDYYVCKYTHFLGLERISGCFHFNYSFDIATLKGELIVPPIYFL